MFSGSDLKTEISFGQTDVRLTLLVSFGVGECIIKAKYDLSLDIAGVKRQIASSGSGATDQHQRDI